MSRLTAICFLLVAIAAGMATRAEPPVHLPVELPADAVWIDVRTPAEYEQGHLEQARLIPFDGIQAGVAGMQLAKDTPIFLYCAVGGRAEKARQSLLAQGYTNVVNVGGLDDARALLAR